MHPYTTLMTVEKHAFITHSNKLLTFYTKLQ